MGPPAAGLSFVAMRPNDTLIRHATSTGVLCLDRHAACTGVLCLYHHSAARSTGVLFVDCHATARSTRAASQKGARCIVPCCTRLVPYCTQASLVEPDVRPKNQACDPRARAANQGCCKPRMRPKKQADATRAATRGPRPSGMMRPQGCNGPQLLRASQPSLSP